MNNLLNIYDQDSNKLNNFGTIIFKFLTISHLMKLFLGAKYFLLLASCNSDKRSRVITLCLIINGITHIDIGYTDIAGNIYTVSLYKP